jgi:ABC-type multidrug transport system fused ATPase/permease subunit
LLPRLIEAAPNSVLVDALTFLYYPLAQLRGAIGVVPKETFRFRNSLTKNIAFGVETSALAEI